MVLLQRTESWPPGPTAKEEIMSAPTTERSQMARFFDWLNETFERQRMRDHDRYVSSASNPRELSQRLHRIENGEDSFHA